MKGMEVFTKQISESMKSEISLESQSPGIYLIRILGERKMEAIKIMKQ
jgi:hypothetical protein